MTNSDSQGWFVAVVQTLQLMGVVSSKSDLRVRFSDIGGNVSIAVPKARFALALPGDDTKALEEAGWHVVRLARGDLDPFARVFESLALGRSAQIKATLDPNVKTTSKAEDRLLDEILRRGLPVPDRNYKFIRDNGKELTTPDFTWEAQRLVFFLDGNYWHSVKSDNEIVQSIKKDRTKKLQKTIVDARRDKVEKDGAIRRELTAMGWTTMQCSDLEIDSDAGLAAVVDDIARALREADDRIALKASLGDGVTGEAVDNLAKLFGKDSRDDSAPDMAAAPDDDDIFPVSYEDDEDLSGMTEEERRQHIARKNLEALFAQAREKFVEDDGEGDYYDDYAEYDDNFYDDYS